MENLNNFFNIHHFISYNDVVLDLTELWLTTSVCYIVLEGVRGKLFLKGFPAYSKLYIMYIGSVVRFSFK